LDQLLQDYAHTGRQESFRLLVLRYVGIVYAAARRQLYDPGLAQDATQAVFILLSEKARSLARSSRADGLLGGWLLQATCFVCRDIQKRETRRRLHERKAAMQRPEARDPRMDTPADDLKPLLDAALMTLGRIDRSSLVMRHLQGRSLREVGEALGISEEAARKRVARALDRLRAVLRRTGLAVPETGTLALPSTESAPAAVLAAVLTTPIAKNLAVAHAAGRLLRWAQVKTTVAAGLVVLAAAGSSAAIVARTGTRPNAAATPPTATSPALVTTIPPALDGPITYHGTLVDAEGKPVGGAHVRSYLRDEFDIRSEWDGATSPDGSFAVGPVERSSQRANRVVVFDAPGKALGWWEPRVDNPWDEFSTTTIDLHPTTNVEGTITDSHGSPVADAVVEGVARLIEAHGGQLPLNAATIGLVKTDEQGKYHFDRIPEGSALQLAVRHPQFITWSTQAFEARSASTTFPVTAGTLDADIQLESRPASLHVQLVRGGTTTALQGLMLNATNVEKRFNEWHLTDKNGAVDFRGLPSGTFTIRLGQRWEQPQPLECAISEIALNAGDVKSLMLPLGEAMLHGKLLVAGTGQPGSQVITIAQQGNPLPLGRIFPNQSGDFAAFVPPGRYTLRTPILKDGKVEYPTTSVTASASPSPPVMLETYGKVQIKGRLLDENGQPLPGAIALDGDPVVNVGPDGKYTLTTDPQIDSVFGVAMDLNHKRGCGFFFSTTADAVTEHDMTLLPMSIVEGVAIDRDGHAIPRPSASLIFAAGDRLISPSMPPWKTEFHEDGSFTIGPVPVMQNCRLWSLLVRQEDRQADVRIRGLLPGQSRDLGPLMLLTSLEDAKDTAAEHPLREPWDAQVSGRVLDADGHPLVGAIVQASIPGTHGGETAIEDDAWSDLKGRFTLKKLPRHEQLHLVAGRNLRDFLPANIPASPGSTHLELRLQPRAAQPAPSTK
jgi:RNA polymerase sigma factor (sigma-70 family)